MSVTSKLRSKVAVDTSCSKLKMSASAGFTAQEVRDLRMVFGAFDVSARGLVDAEDLRRALRVLGFKVSRRTVQEMGRDVDVEGTLRGRVDFEGFLQVVARLQGSSYDSHEEIIQGFHMMDRDGDQMLSLQDLKQACTEAGLKLSKAELQGMLDEADKDGDGKISQQEFVQVMLKTSLFR